MCSFVCCFSFDLGVILCDVCYLFVVSYCKPLPQVKTHLQLINITLRPQKLLFTDCLQC
jgi:hypothetical protein